MKVLVCGGREYHDWPYLCGAMDVLHADNPITVIIHGGARGADSLAKNWATLRKVQSVAYPVKADDWAKYGKAAGVIRNKTMLEHSKPDLVVVFPGQNGTKDMMDRAIKAGVETIVMSSPDSGVGPKLIF